MQAEKRLKLDCFFYIRSSDIYQFAEIMKGQDNYTIPKIIHFIWIGPPIQEKYVKNIQSFVVNADYEVKIKIVFAQSHE